MKLKIPVNIPFSPSAFPFFYGWIILFAGIIGVLMSIPGQTMGVSVFTDHLIRDLEISRIQLSFAYLIGTLSSGLLITYAGILYDRAGARLIAIGAGLMFGGVLVYLSNIDFFIEKISGLFNISNRKNLTIILMIFGFFGIRFFGQGVLTMTSRNMVMKWFDKKRGFANGILGVFTSFGFSYSPLILQELIDNNGWKGSWFILALVAGLFFVLFAFIFFRDNPKDLGQIPDGKIIPTKNKRFQSTPDKNYDLPEALASYSFWIFNLNISLIALYFTAFTFNVESIFNSVGLDSTKAFSIFLPGSVIAAVVHISGSWLSDYIRLKYILIFSFAGLLVSALGLLFLNTGIGYYILILGNGIIIGTFNILIAVTWPRFYGLKNLGKISGFVMSCSVGASALGPFLFSLSEKHFRTYNPAAILILIITSLLLILSFRANNINDRN